MSQSQTASNATLKASTHPVADKVKATLHDSVDTLSEKAAATEASLRESAKEGSETLSAKQQELEKQWEQSAVKKYAVKNPIATAGMAFAAGVLVTALFNRK